MRLLLDESLPIELAGHITGHDVVTVRGMNWLGIKNGRLLSMAAADGFDAFITPDTNIEFQQNLAKLPMTVIVLRAHRNRISDLLPLLPELLAVLETAAPGSFARVGG